MADPNLRAFYGRVARIQRAHAKGYGFEAAGTLGRSYYNRMRASPRRSYLAPFLVIVCAVFAVKGLLHYRLGAEDYQSRVASLAAGEGFDRLGAVLLQADPVTVMVSDFIATQTGVPRPGATGTAVADTGSAKTGAGGAAAGAGAQAAPVTAAGVAAP